MRTRSGLGAFALLLLTACGAEAPPHLREAGGPLATCPHRPNCVFSLAAGAAHHIEPLQYAGAAQHAREALIKLIESRPGGKVVQSSADYVRAEFTSARLRFVDDVEFLIAADTGTIQVRSASRVGYSDRGVNRARVEAIRAQLLPTIYEISILRPGA